MRDRYLSTELSCDWPLPRNCIVISHCAMRSSAGPEAPCRMVPTNEKEYSGCRVLCTIRLSVSAFGQYRTTMDLQLGGWADSLSRMDSAQHIRRRAGLNGVRNEHERASRNNVLERVRQIVSDVFAVPLERVDATSSPETIEAWDSMQHLNLVLAVEDTFDLQFTPEEMELMRNVKQIVTVVELRK